VRIIYVVKRATDSPSTPLFYAACEDNDIEDSLDSDTIARNVINVGFPERQHVERRLLRKLDLRMSILVVIYTLNYVSQVASSP
jgi:hypothetical protein